MKFSIDLGYDVGGQGCDFIFNFHAAHTRSQTVVEESLQVSQQVAMDLQTDHVFGNRYLRMHAFGGPLHLSYHATVDIDHFIAAPETLQEAPIAQLPIHVLPYIYPSRYCQSDRLLKLAAREFGHLPHGYSRVRAIQDWVLERTTFTSMSSNSTTSALDTIIEQIGVCRDFAHLMIALCRAISLPARFATGIDYGADPILGPTDFHAYVEVFVGGRWYIFDASGTAVPMGFVRFGTGRDAADVAFATMFGPVIAHAPVITVAPLVDPANGFFMPLRRPDAISTSGEFLN